MLLTNKIEKKLPKIPELNKLDDVMSYKIIVKFFHPCEKMKWYIIAGEKIKGDWKLLGYLEGPYKGLRYFNLSDILSIVSDNGVKVERDIYFDENKTLKDVIGE